MVPQDGVQPFSRLHNIPLLGHIADVILLLLAVGTICSNAAESVLAGSPGARVALKSCALILCGWGQGELWPCGSSGN